MGIFKEPKPDMFIIIRIDGIFTAHSGRSKSGWIERISLRSPDSLGALKSSRTRFTGISGVSCLSSASSSSGASSSSSASSWTS